MKQKSNACHQPLVRTPSDESMEADERGILSFQRKESKWTIEAVNQEYEGTETLVLDDIDRAISDFVIRLTHEINNSLKIVIDFESLASLYKNKALS